MGERELLFVRNKGIEKMTVGGRRVWYKYHPRHPQNGQVRQTPEPPRQNMEVPRRPEQIRIQLGWLFVARII